MHTASSVSPSTLRRKPALTIGAHWLSALAIVLAFTAVWLRELVEGDALRALILGLHRQLGLLVLLLWAVRLLLRWTHPARASGQPLPPLLHWAAAASHAVLYLVLLAMPVLGWAATNAQGHAVLWLNAVPLPTLVATDPDVADTLQEWHGWGGWTLGALVLSHLVAALWHHVVRRDHVLATMLPLVQPRAPRTSND